jgi:hypothetical protein
LGIELSEEEKGPDLPLEPGEEIIKVTDKYRADFRDSGIGLGSRTVKVILTNKRLAILPSKWSAAMAIMKGSVLSAIKSGETESIIIPLIAITAVKTNMMGGGISVATTEKKFTLNFKSLNGFWEKDIKKAVESAKG